MAELRELCRTAGIVVADVVEQRRPEPDPKYLVGRGKLEDMLLRAMQLDAAVLIFDPDLTPGQARAIADVTDLKVLDRTMLILDIFAQHARSRDGKLQVELAQLRYRLPRLHEKNTMMSRLTGGIGGRGPGETKLEINRRRARERIHRLEQEIDRFGRQRVERRAAAQPARHAGGGHRRLHQRRQVDAAQHADRQRRAGRGQAVRHPGPDHAAGCAFPREREVIITDTVGFIRDLPKDLAHAFRATLEELDDADLLVHVVDAADPDHEQQIAAVERILARPGAGRDAPAAGAQQDRSAAARRIGPGLLEDRAWWPSPPRTPAPRRPSSTPCRPPSDANFSCSSSQKSARNQPRSLR